MPTKLKVNCSQELPLRRLKLIWGSLLSSLYMQPGWYACITTSPAARGSAISQKDGRKLALHKWSMGKCNSLQRIPSRILSVSLFNAVSTPFWLTSVFVLWTFTEHLKLHFKHWTVWYTLHRQHTRQAVISCLVHNVLCRTVVSIQSCFETSHTFYWFVTSALWAGFTRIKKIREIYSMLFLWFFLQSPKLVLAKSNSQIFRKLSTCGN